LPRKTFVANEILTASDVNEFLMDQSVMVFAGSAARGSAIPSPSEGMVTYREDDNAVEVFDGSVYKPVGGLVEVKSALFTGTQSASVLAGSNVAVTNLSITHTMANSSNKLIISAYIGAAATSTNLGNVVMGVTADGTLIGGGASPGNRTVGLSGGASDSGNAASTGAAERIVQTPAATFVYEPGDTASHTYAVVLGNVEISTATLYINRTVNDADLASNPRVSSGLVIQEVAV
jgi:hypothetical protein